MAGVGIFDEGGGGVDFAGEEMLVFGGEIGVECGDFLVQAGEVFGVEVEGWAGGGLFEFFAEVADLGGGVGEEARNLGFKGAGVDDLSERGVGGKGEQIAGYVEGAGFEGAVVGVGLHFGGAGDAGLEGFVDGGGGGAVGGEEVLHGLGVEGFGGGVGSEVGEVPAGFEEVLVAGGALLAVPALFVDEDDGGEEREAFDCEGDVGEVGDGAVAVLKIEGVEKLLGALGVEFAKRLAHGKRRSRILGHGIRQDLRVGAMNSEDFRLVARLGGGCGGCCADRHEIPWRSGYGIEGSATGGKLSAGEIETFRRSTGCFDCHLCYPSGQMSRQSAFVWRGSGEKTRGR